LNRRGKADRRARQNWWDEDVIAVLGDGGYRREVLRRKDARRKGGDELYGE